LQVNDYVIILYRLILAKLINLVSYLEMLFKLSICYFKKKTNIKLSKFCNPFKK